MAVPVAPAAALGDAPPGTPPVAEILAKAAAENFPVALRFLPRRERAWLGAVYGFARLVDDLGDEVAGDRLALLDEVEADLERAYEGRAEHPLLRRLTPFLEGRRVPRDPFLRLIEANRVDQRVDRYATFDALVGYCRLSADPVGELVLHVFDAATPDRIVRSNGVCTALQLVEHWQDVGEDLRRNRVYVPQDDLRRFGVSEADLAAARPGESLKQLLAFEVARTRGLLASGVPLVESLRGHARLAVAAYVGGGRAALDAVERSGFEVLVSAPRAANRARLQATLAVLREAR
jgi:squalene synthase HpnC